MATTGTFGWPTPDDSDFVRDGAAAIRALGNAVDSTLASGFTYAGTRYFFSTGNFEKADPLLSGPIGLRAIRVRMVGGGGGGGGSQSTLAGTTASGSGGGGGAYAEAFITDIAGLDASVLVTRGAGGTAGPVDTNGGAGGGSSFGALVTASGGDGGSRGARGAPVSLTAQGAAGGQSGTGDLVIPGGGSINGTRIQVDLAPRLSGSASHLSGIQEGRFTVGNTTGAVGQLFGGGGQGGASIESQAGAAGGAGGNGIVIVDCFI
jgi:hypothetical protein